MCEADLDTQFLEVIVLQFVVVKQGFERQSDLDLSTHAHKLGFRESAEV